MHDTSTSEKCGQLLEEIAVLFCDIVGHPRVERQLSRIRSTAIDLQGRILHLEQKADAESEAIESLCTELGRSRSPSAPQPAPFPNNHQPNNPTTNTGGAPC